MKSDRLVGILRSKMISFISLKHKNVRKKVCKLALSSGSFPVFRDACNGMRRLRSTQPSSANLRASISPLPATLGGPLRSSHHQLACYHILSHNKHVISALVIVECVLVSLRHVLAWNWPENWPLSIILNTFVIGGEKPIDTLRGFSALWPRRVAIHIIHLAHMRLICIMHILYHTPYH